MDVSHSGPVRDGRGWLFFMFQLPAQRASQRVRVWRKLQKYGALAWKNSVYILPGTPTNLEKFQWLAVEIRKQRGDASILRVARVEGTSKKEIVAAFNQARARDYEQLIGDLRVALRDTAAQSRARRASALRRLHRRQSEILAVDTFDCPRRKEAEALLEELEARSNGSERGARTGSNGSGQFQGRIWMTRPRPGIDRVSSAWLIRRFIDPKAKFIFSSDPGSHRGAVRFDMFGGEFTHVGDRCTFETLMERFKLRDKRLRRVAQMVHDADLEDEKYGRPEGKALELIFTGWAKMKLSDGEVLRKGFELYDAMYLTLGSH